MYSASLIWKSIGRKNAIMSYCFKEYCRSCRVIIDTVLFLRLIPCLPILQMNRINKLLGWRFYIVPSQRAVMPLVKYSFIFIANNQSHINEKICKCWNSAYCFGILNISLTSILVEISNKTNISKEPTSAHDPILNRWY